MWVALDVSTVTKLSPTGALLGTYSVGTNPSGIAFDGCHMWVANYGPAQAPFDPGSVTEL
jgi:hypothetical protein